MREHSWSGNKVRKRVCKACDRCRLKKSKCDGVSPCLRCRADNAICVFGAQKKAHDKVYPNGYVELLLHQQDCLVHGLQELYQRAISSGSCLESLKARQNEHLPTHDLLSCLDALDLLNGEHFEENPETMQQNLWSQTANLQRESSFDSSIQGSDFSVVADHSFVDALSQHFTPPASSASWQAMTSESTVRLEEQMACNLQPTPQMSLQGSDVNTPLLQGCPLQWDTAPVNQSDGIDYSSPAYCPGYGLEGSLPWFNCPCQLDCDDLSSVMYNMEVCDNWNQFIKPVLTELKSNDGWN